jgi:hypothetical protein
MGVARRLALGRLISLSGRLGRVHRARRLDLWTDALCRLDLGGDLRERRDAVRSRVFAAQEGAAHLSFSVSALSGGLIVQLVSAPGAFAVATAFGVAAAVIAASTPRTSPLTIAP